MAVKFYQGDMFDAPADARVNPVNAVGVMGKGLAKQFAHRYPRMLLEYKRACRTGDVRAGRIWTHKIDNLTIYNACTKDDWRNPSERKWVESCLVELAILARRDGVRVVTVPALGCGLGGLDWDELKPLFSTILKPGPVKFEVYEG